jgi:hypothetical protein
MVFVVLIIVLAFSALVLGVDKMFLNRAFFRHSLVDSELRGIRNGEPARRPMPHTFCLIAKLGPGNVASRRLAVCMLTIQESIR